MRRWSAGMLCCAWLVLTPEARAGTYDVWGCRLPNARPAETDGWRPYRNEPPFMTNQCENGRGLFAMFDDTRDIGRYAALDVAC